MRTFEESMLRRRAQSLEESQEAEERLEKYSEMTAEIGNHPLTQSMIVAIVTGVERAPGLDELNEGDLIMSLLLSVFINGVQIGIDMERQED